MTYPFKIETKEDLQRLSELACKEDYMKLTSKTQPKINKTRQKTSLKQRIIVPKRLIQRQRQTPTMSQQ